ncbi:OB-fold nucleic acid binding domain-containing protein, partial [Flavobacteriales bacterium]|nr:OB-fold nucleic acid binding domain-containing protein [Flavobacteriales bacterium]
MKHTKVKTLLQGESLNETVCVKGWVRTKRGSKNVSFIAINDGSTINNIQAVAESESFDEELIKQITTGACLRIVGALVESQGSGQKVEITAQEIEVLGEADADIYPLQPKKHSLEFLRDKAHLRFRTNTFSAVFRVRHALSFAIHKFFNDKGFVNLHTPIITG